MPTSGQRGELGEVEYARLAPSCLAARDRRSELLIEPERPPGQLGRRQRAGQPLRRRPNLGHRLAELALEKWHGGPEAGPPCAGRSRHLPTPARAGPIP